MAQEKYDGKTNQDFGCGSQCDGGVYMAYIPQMADNLAGNKSNPIQQFVAFVNCTLWTGYGLFKKPRDWPIVVANVPGIVLELVAFLPVCNAFK